MANFSMAQSRETEKLKVKPIVLKKFHKNLIGFIKQFLQNNSALLNNKRLVYLRAVYSKDIHS